MSLADDIAARVSLVRVESSFLPTIELDHPFQPGPPSVFLQYLQPKITIAFDGLNPVVIAPYGEPTEGGGLVLAGGLMVAAFAGAKFLKR